VPLELLRQYTGQSLRRYWYVLDGHSTVVALTDSGGNVVDRYGYDAWGAPIASQTSESVPQPLRYAGYWYDQAVGWYWVGARSYDPGLKRWLQPGPSARDDAHDYVYVNDAPVDTIDPTGLDEVAGLPGDNGLNFIVGGVFAGVVLLAVAPAALSVGTAVLIGAVVYHVSRIEYGHPRTATIPAYLPHPGDIQSTPVEGGTTATIPGQITVPTIHQFAKQSKGRPRSNVEQNKQFDAAVREIERRIGRKLSKDEIRELHNALHDEGNPGYNEIVQVGLELFG